MCDSIHKRPSDKTLDLSSLSPSSSSSNTYAPTEPKLRLFTPEHDNKLTATLLMDPVASSSDAIEVEYASRFKEEMNAENLETLCNALRSKAPRQKDVIPEIAKAILKCRSGSTPRKLRNGNRKEETWLLFQGVDVEAKEKIGRELAKLVFGSQNNFVSISLSSFSSSSMEDLRKKKRRRDEDSWSYTQRLFEAVSCNPHRVFFVEDIEEADYLCQMSFKRAIEKGRLQSGSGEEAFLRDAIVILSCERFSSRSRACSPLEDERKMRSPCLSLDLNLSLDHDDGNDDDDDDGHCSDHIGLLDAVDAHVLFNGSSTRFM